MIYHQSLFELILLVIPKIRFHFQLSVSPISSEKCCVICYALLLMRFIYHNEIYLIPLRLSFSFFCMRLSPYLIIHLSHLFIIKKIVGANEGLFVEEIVAVVAEACESDFEQINHSTKVNGKWVSVTCHAPVQNAEMLYALYEKIDLDPRVKFKF